MTCKLQLQTNLSRSLAVALDDAGKRRRLSRARICRAAAIDPSTIWRAVRTGQTRGSTLADYSETLLGMITRNGREPDLTTPASHELIRRICLWISDRRDGDASIDQDVATLTVHAGGEAFRRRFGAVGPAFSDLVNLRASGATMSSSQRVALSGLAMVMIDEIDGAQA
ncbi:MAG: hypothetical protein RJQ02_09515 [Hyphomonas sp.]|jgi:hypothetical protein